MQSPTSDRDSKPPDLRQRSGASSDCGGEAAVWIPQAAGLTPASRADNEHAPALIRELPRDVRFLLSDQHYHDAELVFVYHLTLLYRHSIGVDLRVGLKAFLKAA